MREYKLFYKDFLTKAATFSYDDGTFYDVFLTEALNKYGLKCTFNLNSGLFNANAYLDFGSKIVYHDRLPEEQTKMIYAGHEIAGHSLTHPLLTDQTKEFLDEQVLTDLANLDRITGEKTVGFAYPGGPHDEFSDAYLRGKVLYARAIRNTHSFQIPEEFVAFDPTVFHMEPEFVDICKSYIDSMPDEATWLYIWGHSYEFSLGDTYKNFIKVCKMLSKRKDIWFATNRDIIRYVVCGRSVKIENGELVNGTDVDVYLEYQGKRYVVRANSRLKI